MVETRQGMPNSIGPCVEYWTTDKQKLEGVQDEIGLCMSIRFDHAQNLFD